MSYIPDPKPEKRRIMDFGHNCRALVMGDVIRTFDGSVHYIQYVNSSGAYAVPLASVTREIVGREVAFTAGGKTISARSLVELINPLTLGGNSPEYRRYVKMVAASRNKGAHVVEHGVSFTEFDSDESIDDEGHASFGASGTSPTGKGVKMAKKAANKANGAAKVARVKAEKTVRPCVCGCGTETTSYFAPGHDARYHGYLKKLADGRIDAKGKDAKSGEQVILPYLLKKLDMVATKEGHRVKNPNFYREA